ncbi:MAG: hypothetical protein J6Z34_01545 [Clostridia bacterium]|nr:hypothetical protein [Clostridia bacterium]
MNITELLKKHRARLTKEAVIKSLLIGLLIGFSAMLVSATVFWMVGVKAFWLSFIVLAVFSAVSSLWFYFFKFRPDDKSVARRVDAVGREERMITMNEFQGETDYIYEHQRKDAVAAVSKFNASLLKITVSIAVVIALSVILVLSSGMTVLSALSATGVIPSGGEIIRDIEEQRNKRFFEVSYVPEGGGMFEGDEVQIVEEGKDATPILAVADDGWIFVYWSDGVEDPYRTDINVRDNMEIIAYFQEAEEGEGEGDPNEGDQPSDQPGDPGDNDQPSDQPSQPFPTGGGKYDPANQVFNGETYYGGDIFQSFYGDAVDNLSQDGSTNQDVKDYIDDYYRNIAE